MPIEQYKQSNKTKTPPKKSSIIQHLRTKLKLVRANLKYRIATPFPSIYPSPYVFITSSMHTLICIGSVGQPRNAGEVKKIQNLKILPTVYSNP